MRGVMNWLQHHPWVYAALLVLVDAGTLMAFAPSRSPLGAVLSAMVYVGIFFAIRRRNTRKDRRAAGNGQADVQGLSRMLLKGRVPEEPRQREEMRGLLRRRVRQLRWLRWYVPIFTALILALGGAALADGARVPGIGLIVMMGVMDVWFVTGIRRQRRNVRRMDRALGAH